MKTKSVIGILAFVSVILNAASHLPLFDKSIICVDSIAGRIVWTLAPKELHSADFEAYDSGIKVRLTQKKTNPDRVLFVSKHTGEEIPPFETRRFVYPWDDPLRAHSAGKIGSSIHEEREELLLSNRWRSYGVAALSWNNAGANRIYFFDRSSPILKWTLDLPEGSNRLWSCMDYLFYSTSVADLVAVKAGENSVAWSFVLPAEIPTVESTDEFAAGMQIRSFSFCDFNGQPLIESNGYLMLLDLKTGEIDKQWKYWPDMKGEDSDFGIAQNAEIVCEGNTVVVAKSPFLFIADLEWNKITYAYKSRIYRMRQYPMIHEGRVVSLAGPDFVELDI